MPPPELPYTLAIWDWETPASHYRAETVGSARIVHGTYSCGYYPMWGLDNYVFFRVRRPIPVTELQLLDHRWHTVMVDDPPQYRAMQIFAEHSRGQVLTTGLGLGLIAHELVKNPLVERIVVVERSPDVIALVGKYIPAEVEVIEDDFYAFIERDRTSWDSIVVDLWVTTNPIEKLRAFHTGVLPLNAELRRLHPYADISFHGFPTVSDVQVVSEPMMRFISELKPYGP